MRVTAALILMCLILPARLTASIYVVNPDGTGDFPTIQAAVDGSVSGDVIELTDGTFTGPGNRDIWFHGRNLTIRSQSGDPARTTLDCEEAGRAFLLGSSEEGRFEGMTMTRGRAPDFGGAVISGMAVQLSFLRCIFLNNSSVGNAGAVMVWDCSFARFEGCTFIGNSSTAGGAVCT